MLTPEEIEMAKRYAQRSIAEGRTTVAPSQNWSYTQITRLRRGTPPRRVKSGVPCVPARIVALLADFLKVQTEPFMIDDFKNWLARSGIILQRVTVKMYLCRLTGPNRLAQVVRGVHGRNAQYQKLSAPEETVTTQSRSKVRRMDASTPARNSTLTVCDAMLRTAITGFCFLLSQFLLLLL